GSTPQEIALLRSVIEAAAKSPKNDQTFRRQGYERLPMGPGEFAALVDKARKEAVAAITAVEQAPVVMPEKMMASFGVCDLPPPAPNERFVIVNASPD